MSVRRTIGSPYDDPPPLVSGSRFSAVYREEREQHGKQANIGDKFQFMRNGYFVVDEDTTAEKLVLNQIVSLKDSFSRTL